MTITTQNQKVPTATTSRTGFQPIPTRIKDLRDAQPAIPPLVVEPAEQQRQQAVELSLAELGSKLADVHRTAAEAYLSQGNYEKSLPHLEAAIAMAPTESEYQHQIGLVRYMTGDDAGAVKSFNTVLSQEPGNSEAWFNLGMVLFGQNQFPDAETCFGRALAISPNEAQTWNNRGVCLWRMGRNADAKVCFQRALQIDANDVDAHYNLKSIG
ncbi:MAG: tetratricopeptide repeat protein [Planctomycetota bacterium]